MTRARRWLLLAVIGLASLTGLAVVTRSATPDPDWHSVPPPAAGLGVREVRAVIDSAGRGVIAYATLDGVEILEEGPAGAWSLRRPAEKLGADSFPDDLVAGRDGRVVLAFSRLQLGKPSVFLSERDPEGVWRHPVSEGDAISHPPTAYAPRLASNAHGEWLLVYDQWYDPGHYGVAVARRTRSSAGWQRPARADDVLSPPLFFANLPTVALDDSGQALVGWFQSVGGPLRAFVSARKGSGAELSRPQAGDALSSAERAVANESYANVQPALGPGGAAALIWTEEAPGEARVYLSTRQSSAAFPHGTALSRSGQIARSASLAYGPEGVLFIVWVEGEAPAGRVVMARRSADGSWLDPGSRPRLLSTPGARASWPVLRVSNTAAVVAWQEQDGQGPSHVAVRTVSGEPGPLTVLGEGARPAAALNDEGRTLVAWHRGAGRESRIALSIREAR